MEVLYSVVGKEKKRERFETILEPLQAITQLAALAFCPKGSKLSISNNLLYVQHPTWSQGILRSYNQDARDDLYFLFNVIKRFNKFYSLNTKIINEPLFEKLIELSKVGITNLIQTYSNSDKNSLLHTLRMYRTMLDKPDMFNENEDSSDEDSQEGMNSYNKENNIDNIFQGITNIYKPFHIELIHNTLKMISDDPEHYQVYLDGLNTILSPIHSQINKWISDNIVF